MSAFVLYYLVTFKPLHICTIASHVMVPLTQHHLLYKLFVPLKFWVQKQTESVSFGISCKADTIGARPNYPLVLHEPQGRSQVTPRTQTHIGFLTRFHLQVLETMSTNTWDDVPSRGHITLGPETNGRNTVLKYIAQQWGSTRLETRRCPDT